MSDPITIVIIDDHEVVRKGVRSYLDTLSDMQVVGEAASGEEGLALVEETIPDIVLVDLIMPGMDGVETTRRIKEISPRTQIVVLTSYHKDAHIFPALKAGAISYILKDVKMDQLADTLRKTVRGEVVLHPRVASRVLKNIRGDHDEDLALFANLTDREQEVLKLIANGLPNREIAEELVISENTVKGHVSNILSKLHVADRTQVAVFAWQQGLVQRRDL